MITCTQCGRTDGNSQLGTSWICQDCKVGETNDGALPSDDPNGGTDKRSKNKDAGQQPQG